MDPLLCFPAELPAEVTLALQNAGLRTAILSNEKYRGVRLQLAPNRLKVMAHNPEQEEAEDQVETSFEGDDVEIGFNVTYLLDALDAMTGKELYSSGDQIKSFVHFGGLSIANGHVYLGTFDSILYCFGLEAK